jgi:hypothetical protein
MPKNKKTVVYIAHPISGMVDANLLCIRAIVRKINTDPQHADIVPFAPYISDALALNDTNAAERERGLQNDIELLTRPGVVDELWLYGPRLSEGMKLEVKAAVQMGIPIRVMSPAVPLKEQFEYYLKSLS